MKLTRRIIAALMLLAWLMAGAHVALEHGGEGFGTHLGEVAHDDHHDDDHDAPSNGDEHHHDLSAVLAQQGAKSIGQPLFVLQWTPLYARVVAELAAMFRDTTVLHEPSFAGESPPDERASGWLFVVQTALQVRGPSLAA